MRSLILSLFLSTFHTLILLVSSQGFPFQKPNDQNDQITNFYQCVNFTSNSHIDFSKGFFDPNYNLNSFTSTLNSTAENLRCLAKAILKPTTIFTPVNYRQVQAAVVCAIQTSLNFRIRSGGHDYEGLSYISLTGEQFVLIDLRNIRKVDIDISTNTAWVDAGVTTGELYYKISQKSSSLAFPAGLCTDLGIGGHITGGAYGSLMRKHGLGVDNVLDAKIVDSWGRILNRRTMGEDLFWAIRGGGGSSFGVIVSWKIRLVRIPELVTYFSVQKFVSPGNKDNLRLLQKWQTVAPNIDDELFIRVLMFNAGPNTTLTMYQGLYLGKAADLLNTMKSKFSELRLQKTDYTEKNWIDSVMFMAGFPKTMPTKELLNPNNPNLAYFKAKSDFVKQPIPENGIEKMLRIFGEGGAAALMIWTPYGGVMSKVAEDETAFSQRSPLFMIQYVASWNEDNPKLQLENEAWVRNLYKYMTRYVTNSPRLAYVNYRDLDIGKPDPNCNCSDPDTWGPKYYNGNYPRLVEVKTMVDPLNVFHNEQSIPTASMAYECTLFDVGMVKVK